ncbi:hypothetical protein MKX01_009452 [Papaver californicum]|nr:hypothetical protein MKX01_009452 [Papaver californicum]
MKFDIDDITVYFPYEKLYPEQYQYMVDLKRTLDAKGSCILGMPTGTGKTIALLSLITSYSLSKPWNLSKLIYCTRTVHEMEKTLAELRVLHEYQLKHLGSQAGVLSLGLSSRKNLCINPNVNSTDSRDSVDAGCRKLTASWVRETALNNPNNAVCDSLRIMRKLVPKLFCLSGVYTLQDLRSFGREKGWCPYYLARQMIQCANIVVYTYQYMIDPKVAGLISKEMQRECVVVFDEAHNINNVCVEALSVSVRQQTLDGTTRNLNKMDQEIDSHRCLACKSCSAERCSKRACIRKHSKSKALYRCIEQINTFEMRLQSKNVEMEIPLTFVDKAGIDKKVLRFCYDRLHSLMMSLQITIQTICDFATLVGTYTKGFSVIIEPFDEKMPHISDPVLQCNEELWTTLAGDGCHCSRRGRLFFDSYSYTDSVVGNWNEMGILQDIMQHKLVFIETQDVVETTLALDNYRRACDCGRGAVFLSVAGGKVAEGIDFDQHYGRPVIIFGVPFQYTLSRYSCHDKLSELASWILSHLPKAHQTLSTDMALHIAKEVVLLVHTFFSPTLNNPNDKHHIEGKCKCFYRI